MGYKRSIMSRVLPPTVSKIISCYDLGSYRVGPLMVWDPAWGKITSKA